LKHIVSAILIFDVSKIAEFLMSHPIFETDKQFVQAGHASELAVNV
jgi:hypothetical protein